MVSCIEVRSHDMPTKEERKAEALKHNGMVKGIFESEIAKAVETAVIYEDGDGRDLELPEPRYESTEVKDRKSVV